jgi:hypothetical protein
MLLWKMWTRGSWVFQIQPSSIVQTRNFYATVFFYFSSLQTVSAREFISAVNCVLLCVIYDDISLVFATWVLWEEMSSKSSAAMATLLCRAVVLNCHLHKWSIFSLPWLSYWASSKSKLITSTVWMKSCQIKWRKVIFVEKCLNQMSCSNDIRWNCGEMKLCTFLRFVDSPIFALLNFWCVIRASSLLIVRSPRNCCYVGRFDVIWNLYSMSPRMLNIPRDSPSFSGLTSPY